MRKILVASLLVLLFAGTVWAANAPFATVETSGAPMLVPFRIWNVPSQSGGAYRSGHYEYVQIPMDIGQGTSLASPGMEPVYAPMLPPQGNPAIP